MAPHYPVYVFDAYGTLFDVHSAVARHRDAVGPKADVLSETWRAKQLEYAWTRTLMGRYRDFWTLTEEALDAAAAKAGGLAPELRILLLDAYLELAAYPEVAGVLSALKARGAKTAVLSNGSPDMLEAAIASAGLGPLLDAALSVDALRLFKTDPRAYALVSERFGAARNEVSFQSSNRWDVAGATAFGFRTVWINRAAAPDEYADLPPERVLGSLEGLLDARS
jgi:2-haloacid dehalogenase